MYRAYSTFIYPDGAPDDFTVIAHRGASAYFPENTLVAFQGAMDLGADMIELDVQCTSDGAVVVFHDEKISRCTDGRGRIADYTLARLQKLDAGSWFAQEFRGEKIPTLADVLDLCRNKIAVNIEIKTEAVTDAASGGIEEQCLQIVQSAGMEGHVVYSSFDPRALRHLRQIDSAAPIAVLYERGHFGSKRPSQILQQLGANAFNCSVKELNKTRLDDLRAHAVPFNVYTVNDEDNMKKMLEQKARGIFTNYPDILRKVERDFRWTQKRHTR